MGLRDLFEGPHAVILVLVVVALFGWKRLPDIARGLGRSMRIFKSEMDENKTGGKSTSSPARSHTAEDETVHKTRPQADDPTEV
ncbi:MAG TPA: Sec-independent protein translocase subunit TatA [Actinomycetes bacterium]